MWFDYLPFYHMGLRSKLALTDQLAVALWVTNGANQTEDFNNSKDALLGLVLTPTPAINWTLNYYRGQEHPDSVYLRNLPPGVQSLSNQQGTYILPIANPPNGRLEVADTYVSWQVTQELSFAAEADYVQERLYSYSPPQHVDGGALYMGYQLSPQFALAARAEYLADAGGLFTGVTQNLREATLTFDYRPADGFLLRSELRRDQSNRPYFLVHTPGSLQNSQPTLGLGMVWWFGQKTGAW